MKCSVEKCPRPAKCKTLCTGHYQRWYTTGVWPTTPLKAYRARTEPGPCRISGCPREHRGSGYCKNHQKYLDRLRAKYGLSLEDFYRILVEQRGLCAICEQELSTQDLNNTHVDHCHDTGKVRGILCHGCNVGLGHFKDDPKRLSRAAEYLRCFVS